MAGGDRQSRAQRTRLLAMVAVLSWLLAGAAAFVAVPQMISIGIAVLGLVLAGAVWHSLGAMTANGDTLPVSGVGAPGRAFEAIDPTAVFDRESAEIERLREVEGQLRLAKQEAESATLAKGEFLATMSHEIRTPLNGIVPLIDVVLSSSLNVDQRQCLETAYSSAQQLLSIVDDILDYSKIEANRVELESVSINLRELVDSVAQLMAHPAQAKSVSLSVRFDPNLRPIQRGDPVRLRQVLTNLVSNAVKFTERGGVTVQVGRRGETGTHTQVLFAIVDTGAGIDPESQKRLFQPFMQADSSVTRVFGGTGLGLAICRRLVELMGGEIGVKSTPGHGSTFWFSVPLLKAPGDIATPAHGVEGGRALVVSADQTLIKELGAFFTSAGIQHTQTSLSSDAVARLRGNPKAPRVQAGGYQFAFLDWTGMRLTAQSMARGLLRDPALAHLRIVLLTQPQDEVPEDLRRHSQVLIHPRVFEAGKLRAALDSDGKGEAPLKTVDDLLRTGANDTRDLIVPPKPSTPSQSSVSTGMREIGTGWESPTNRRPSGAVERPPAADSAFLPAAAEVVDAVPPPAAAPRRVLLVEDNPVNRQVAQRLLSIGGLTVDVAEEGATALSMRFSNPPLVILMDCQMPVMDGYASTRAIREREAREGLARMPIIAMTANAMLGDREKCLQAGMDDYLSKPLDRKALAQTLDRWLAVSEGRTTVVAKRREVVSFDLGHEEMAAEANAQSTVVAAVASPRRPEPAAARPPAAREPLPAPEPVADVATEVMAFRALDSEIIDDLIDMMGADFTDLVRIYLHDAPVHVAELHAAVQRDDLAGLVGPAHILKSSSANLGALALAEHARQIETGARQGTLPKSAATMTTELENAYLEASAELTRLLSLRGD